MIELSMIVNRRELVVTVVAKRVYPMGRKPNPGEPCHYEISFGREDREPSVIIAPYGDARILGIEMLREALNR